MLIRILKAIARRAALNSGENHSYQPKTAAEAEQFEPHDWVLQAMQLAYQQGVSDGRKAAAERLIQLIEM